MAKVTSYDPAKLPSAATTPPKYDMDLLAEYTNLIAKGRAAGDGVAYEDKKAATSAANSIKRAIRKHLDGELSLVMRVWQDADGFRFALSQNTRPLTGAAAAAKEGSEK